MLERFATLVSSVLALSDALPEPLVLSRPSGEIVHLNPAAERFFGWTDREIAGFPLVTLLSPGSPAPRAQAEPFAGATARRRDGAEIACAIAERAVDVEGKPLVVWTVRREEPDAERKRALDELARTAAKLRLSLDRVAHVLEDASMDADSKIVVLREMVLTREG